MDYMDFQYYPTPAGLADRMVSKFRSREYKGILDPSAGSGALIDAVSRARSFDRWGRRSVISVYEINAAHHPALRERDVTIAGYDFLSAPDSMPNYSHIIMNPPFQMGAQHVLKAWQVLFSGEVVAIVNAETVRNPCSKERQMLLKIIEQHGSVEFLQEEFLSDDAERKTAVEIALIHLEKKMDISDVVGDLLSQMKKDNADDQLGIAGEYQQNQDIAMQNSFVENAVLVFNAAVRTMRESVFAEARATYYARLVGDTLAIRNAGQDAPTSRKIDENHIRYEIADRYEKLKDGAWAGILHSTEVLNKVSRKVRDSLENQFCDIKSMDFSEANIHAFLAGLAQNAVEIKLEAVMEVFDLITRYHSENVEFYRGWKSNDRHRTCGIKIKANRFILPYFRKSFRSMSQDAESRLRDIDIVFAMLDGKESPVFSMLTAMSHAGFPEKTRVSSDYFDIRWYGGIGTVHFFPKRPDLVDRLNRIVGQRRQWLPPTGKPVSEDFWLQYNKSEQFQEEISAEAKKIHGNRVTSLQDSMMREDSQYYADVMNKVIDTVLQAKGLDVQPCLPADQEPEVQAQLLLAA